MVENQKNLGERESTETEGSMSRFIEKLKLRPDPERKGGFRGVSEVREKKNLSWAK